MQPETQFKSNRLAVLIDADNASANLIEPLLKEVAKYGTSHVKRIYGDWTGTHLGGWKAKLHKFAIQPIQQFSYTTGKNATDSALIIDAMDLLYTQHFDGFCIVSSDSDFTKLASRLRESGMVVYGFGEKKTPEAFISACDKFIYTEILKQLEESSTVSSAKNKIAAKDKSASQNSPNRALEDTESVNIQKLKNNKKLIDLLKDAYEAVDEEDGWAHLGPFGSQLTKLSPSFDARNYGYKKLSELVKAIDFFEIRKTQNHLQIRLKD
jgi:uncharacterized LabA/DUF88 family protein